ncbi:MAG: hypothetical protein WKG07_30565 [Hymenobacter sp.]
MATADHVIEAVEVPYQGRTLPAYLHLPIGYTKGEVPCVVMIEGMDAFKELAIFATGDRFCGAAWPAWLSMGRARARP